MMPIALLNLFASIYGKGYLTVLAGVVAHAQSIQNCEAFAGIVTATVFLALFGSEPRLTKIYPSAYILPINAV